MELLSYNRTATRDTKRETVIRLLPTLQCQTWDQFESLSDGDTKESDGAQVYRGCPSILNIEEDAIAAFEILFGRSHLRVPHFTTIKISQAEGLMAQGTKSLFGAWLKEQKRLTHTAYSRLAIPAKVAIYDEYRKSKRKSILPDVSKEA